MPFAICVLFILVFYAGNWELGNAWSQCYKTFLVDLLTLICKLHHFGILKHYISKIKLVNLLILFYKLDPNNLTEWSVDGII
jgi:hypothetical protein